MIDKSGVPENMSSPIELETAQYHVKKGNELRIKGDIEGAIEKYTKAIVLEPSNLTALQLLAKVYEDLNQLDSAVEVYKNAIKKESNSSIFHAKIGEIYQKNNQYGKALFWYCKAIELDPKIAFPYYKLKYLKLNPEQIQKAINCLQNSLDCNESKLPIVRYIILGDLLSQQGKIDEAIHCYQVAVSQQVINSHSKNIEKQLQAQQSNGPNFIVIGVGKCGTSSLSKYIEQHPEVLPAAEKEIHFFNKKYEFGLDWYKSHFPKISNQSQFITGESTPWYLNSLGVEKRIFQHFPNIKLIVILRNPVHRAFSQYNMHFQKGIEKRSFENVVKSEIKQIRKIKDLNLNYSPPGKGCLGIGLYVYFLERWMSIFPKQQFLILESEDLRKKPQQTMSKVFNFLNLSNCENINFKQYNASDYSPIDANMHSTLCKFFEPYNQKLEKYLDVKFDWS